MNNIITYGKLMKTEEGLQFCNVLINMSNDAILIIDPETSQFLYVNNRACDNLGYDKEELLSMHVTDIEAILPDHFSWEIHVAEIKKTGSMIIEGIHKRKDNTTFPVEVSIRYLTYLNKDYMVAMIRDITDRKNSESALKNERDRFMYFLENMEDGVYIVNQQHDIEYLNPVIKQTFGNDYKKKCYEYFHNRKEACPWCRNEEVFAGKSVKWEFFREDKKKTYEVFDMPIRNPDGTMSKFEILYDISETKQAEEALSLSETKYRTLVETMPYGIQENDTDGIITFSNDAHCQILGFTRDEMKGKDIFDFLSTEEERNNLRHYLKLLVREQPPPSTFFAKNITKDGRVIDVKVDWNYKKDSRGEVIGFISVITDITEQLKAEESSQRLQAQLLHSQKMEAIGRLAGGIAHDFGNILTAIKNFSSIGIKGTRESDPYASNIFDHINSAAYRAMNLTRQLLTFSKKDITKIVNIRLNNIINNLVEMLHNIIGEDIIIATDYGSNLRPILGDSGKLEQVITNLVVNARDAMPIPGGGTIIIRTENILIDEEISSKIPYSRPGQFVRLTVEDTGHGISKQNINNIFEPFFTTKKNGSGSGLGLSVVYAIISDHKGWINVTSEEGVKTIFEVYLPALSSNAGHDSDNKLVIDHSTNKGERILLVEDDGIVRISTKMALEKEGYEVIDADNSASALRIFQKENGRFHMVISDLVLPDQNGLRLIRTLITLKPELKAILNSGYIGQQIDRSEIEQSGIYFLSKPFDIEDLLIAIRELINKN
ncbi:MAG: PAS domain S-box protein [Nitrospirae bacterium]|nr:PAS domain S-box protein [Nitrospirota bacterium]